MSQIIPSFETIKMSGDTTKSKEFLAYARTMVAAGEQRLAAIDQERAGIVKDVAEWREIVSVVAKKVDEIRPEAGEQSLDQGEVSQHGLPGRTDVTFEDDGYDFSEMTHGQSAAIALRRIGHPVTAAKIRDELERMGHHINDDPKLAANILYNSMGRLESIFRKIEGGLWVFVDPSTINLFINR